MLLICTSDALQNLHENKKSILLFVIFLVMSFTGIIVTDSLIYSVSQKAESELNINGDNIITVNLQKPVRLAMVKTIFSSANFKTSASRKNYFKVGYSPFTENSEAITGVENNIIERWGESIKSKFHGNVVIAINIPVKENYIFIAGIPFFVIHSTTEKPTDFLDSLGLSSGNNRGSYIIPLDTMFRLTLDNHIDKIELIKNKEINNNDINLVKAELNNYEIKNYSVTSFLDAKEAVHNVLERFSILTNSIYGLLTLMSLVIVHTVCKRNYQLRCTEFALKVIHGIKIKTIIYTVMIETFITTMFSALLSISVSSFILNSLSSIVKADIHFRF
ncbi:TPA: permease, partial [Escherichia coli]|nr:permease [Escherichia coli]